MKRILRIHPFLRNKIDRFEGNNRFQNEICYFLEPRIFGDEKSTDTRATGSGADALWGTPFYKTRSRDRYLLAPVGAT